MVDKIIKNKIIAEDIELISSQYNNWDSFQDKTILITGANGHIAYYLACTFAYQIIEKKLRAKLILLSKNENTLKEKFSNFDNDNIILLAQDISDPIKLDCAVDYIYHFAGNASPYFIKNDPVGILKANIIGTFNIAEFARKNNSKIIFSSSREIYGDIQNKSLLKEDDYGVIDLLEKRSCYPESKRASEVILNSYYLQYSVPYITLRIAHCYGPEMKINQDGRVMQDFIGNAINGNDIIMKSDGKALRAFCYISDVVNCILKISVEGEIGNAYNVSNELDEISVGELANLIAEIKGDIRVIHDESVSDSSMYCSYRRIGLDCTKVSKHGWTPSIGLKNGLDRTIKSFNQ